MMPEEDPFASVRIRQNKIEPIQQESIQEVPIEQSKESSEDPFASARIKKAEGFPFLYETGRHATRVASRIAETIGGIPGDISNLIQSGVFSGLESIVGHKLSDEGREESKKYRAPTTKELKELSESISGGFTSPESDIEKTVDEYVETASSLLGPMKFRKALGVALGSQLSKEGVKTLGLGETSQESAKLGTMLMLTTLNPGGAMRYASSQYQKANELAKGASINARNLESNLSNLLTDLKKGVSTTSKTSVIKPAEELIGKINNGKIPVLELTAAKRDLNTIMKDPSVLMREKKMLKVVGKEIDNAIKPYEITNPAFSKAYRPANEIYGAVSQGTKAYDFIKRSLGAKSILGSIVAETALGHPEYVIPTLTGMASIGAAAKTGDFLVRLGKSKELQKYYLKSISAALKEDLPALRLYADKFEEEFNRDNLSDQNSRSNKTK